MELFKNLAFMLLNNEKLVMHNKKLFIFYFQLKFGRQVNLFDLFLLQ